MHYIIYKTVNKLNSRYYIGMHQCSTLQDSYLGSNKILKQAIKKYGRKNFERTILHECASLEEMSQLEKQILTAEILNDPQCYNICGGGTGGSAKQVGIENEIMKRGIFRDDLQHKRAEWAGQGGKSVSDRTKAYESANLQQYSKENGRRAGQAQRG